MSKHMPTNCRIVHMAGPLWVAFHFQSVTSSSHFSRDGLQRKQPGLSLLRSLAGQERPNIM